MKKYIIKSLTRNGVTNPYLCTRDVVIGNKVYATAEAFTYNLPSYVNKSVLIAFKEGTEAFRVVSKIYPIGEYYDEQILTDKEVFDLVMISIDKMFEENYK